MNAQYWVHEYSALIKHAWRHMTPEQYGYILIVIAVAGYFFMKSAGRA